jgi:hypothetical protein
MEFSSKNAQGGIVSSIRKIPVLHHERVIGAAEISGKKIEIEIFNSFDSDGIMRLFTFEEADAFTIGTRPTSHGSRPGR